ncbi:MAG: PQQ-binding-like beta-propeller repeat protein [Anaerolineales bacterium]
MRSRRISYAGWGLAIGLLAAACTASPQATSTPVPAIDPEANSNGAMYLADLQHSGVFAAGGGQPVGELKWTFATGGVFMSSPAIAGGVGYFANSDGNLYSVDLEAGQEKWRLEIGHLGWSSPAVAAGLVVVGSQDTNLYAVDVQTGQVRWAFNSGGIIRSSPAISDAIVYFTSADGYLYAVDLQTGQEKWRFSAGAEAEASSPAIADGVVYVGSGDTVHISLYAVDVLTGLERWKYTESDAPAVADVPNHPGSPSLGEGLAFVRRRDYVYAIDLETGQERWKFETKPTFKYSGQAIDNGVVYFGATDGSVGIVFGLDAQTGDEMWRFETGGDAISPSIAGGVAYFWSRSGFQAVEISAGKELWDFQAVGQALGSFASLPAIVDGVVYFGSKDGNVYALK